VMIDIDHFKWVNDNHGHRCGDFVLERIADCLARSFMRKDDFVARYGGEEFAVVLRDVDVETAEGLAERGMMAIRSQEMAFESVQNLRVTASMGISAYHPGESSANWIERADRALYQAKNDGRDRVAVDSGSLDP